MSIIYRGLLSSSYVYWDNGTPAPSGVSDVMIINQPVFTSLTASYTNQAVFAPIGLTGSLTRLTNGTPYLLASGSITISTGSSGAVTIGTSGSIPITSYGTWTPSYNFSTTNSQTYSSRIGTYYKVGRMVVAQFNIILTANGVGNISLINLPFLSETTLDGAGSVQVSYFQNINGGAGRVTNITGQVLSNSTTASLYQVGAITANTSLLTDANFTATTNLVGTAIYLTAN